MALSDLQYHNGKALYRALMYMREAVGEWENHNREKMYLALALASRNIDGVLAVIEDPKDEPRNESPNGPLPVLEKRER